MIKNYLKIAWRNLVRQKLYSLINISGLAVGLAVCMTIMLYVAHELSYDSFHTNAKRIFKLQSEIKIGGNSINSMHMTYATGPMVKQSQPVVEDYVRVFNYYKPLVVSNPALAEVKFSESKLLFADSTFFNFFTFKLLAGSKDNVLNTPFSVVISQEMAEKYFGSENAVGKTLVIKTDSAYTYHVTGVAANSPSNSSINFNFIASNQSLLAMKDAANYTSKQEVGSGSFDVYFLLKNQADSANLRSNLQRTEKKGKDDYSERFVLAPLTDSHVKNNSGDFSNVKYLKIFPVVALLILLLALVNYMSLSTARATIRAKEVSVRKVSGASRKSIAMQFYIESALFSCLSFILSYILCYLLKPWFLNILQLKIDNSFFYSPVVISLLFALLVFTIVAAGSYPSLVLSAFKPVITLKGKMSKQAGGVTVRKVFTTLQFAISVGLIICGIIIDRQLYFFRHTDTGVNRENVLMVPVTASFGKNYPIFKQDVKLLAGVGSVATSHYAMFKGYDIFFIDGKTKNESVALASLAVDDKFITTLGLKWKYPPVDNSVNSAGKTRFFINEAAVAKMHLPPNPVGQFIHSGNDRIEVGGVLKNFNFTSMETAIEPMGLSIASDTSKFWGIVGCNMFVKIKPHTNLPTLINNIKSIYNKYDKDTPFSYSFVDDAFNEQYKAEDRLASIFSVFTVITIVLASLGLFGLAAFTIEQRTREIGIRKVLGASLTTITTLLSRDFLILVILAILIASPVAWWAMHGWLQNFTYRITISWWIFVAAALVAIATAIITISYHSLKAAVANPVKSLRSE